MKTTRTPIIHRGQPWSPPKRLFSESVSGSMAYSLGETVRVPRSRGAWSGGAITTRNGPRSTRSGCLRRLEQRDRHHAALVVQGPAHRHAEAVGVAGAEVV